MKRSIESAAVGSGVNVEIIECNDKPPVYTFMGWHPTSTYHLPFGYGDKFPAFLTKKLLLIKISLI